MQDYIGKHGDKERFVNRLGVDLGWLTNVQPNEIEAKWSGSPTTIVDLKKMRLAAFSNLNLKIKAWDAEFEQALVWLVLFKSCFLVLTSKLLTLFSLIRKAQVIDELNVKRS